MEIVIEPPKQMQRMLAALTSQPQTSVTLKAALLWKHLRQLRHNLSRLILRMERSPESSNGQAISTTLVGEDLKDHSEHGVPLRYPQLYAPSHDSTTISPANLLLAKTWLSNCLSNHPNCSIVPEARYTPRRVIDITSPRRPLLKLMAKGRNEAYATLSYQWGRNQRCITTTANYQQNLTGIPLRKMPQTFVDAITVSSSLGVHYLWIDALCIIQDDKNDTTREISVMDQVYSNATFTIFAAIGSNPNAGLSISRDPRWRKPCKVHFNMTYDSNITTTFSDYVYIKYEASKYNDDPIQDSSLYTRGWVLQEQVLTRRSLIFGSSSGLMKWKCSGAELSEEEPFPDTLSNLSNKKRPDDVLNRVRCAAGHSESECADCEGWYRMVEHYSRRSLTHSADALPALSGLANVTSKTYKWTYLAGLWMEDLSSGLVWYIYKSSLEDSFDERPPPSTLSNHAQDSHRVPSWSWASQYGWQINFLRMETYYREKHRWCLQFISWEERRSPFSASLDSSQTSMYLTVSGQLKNALIRYGMTPCSNRKKAIFGMCLNSARWREEIADPSTGTRIGMIGLDGPPQSAIQIHCLLSLVYERWDDSEWMQHTCLALVPVEGYPGVYRRIGLIDLEHQSWFGDPRSDDSGNEGRFLTTVTII